MGNQPRTKIHRTGTTPLRDLYHRPASPAGWMRRSLPPHPRTVAAGRSATSHDLLEAGEFPGLHSGKQCIRTAAGRRAKSRAALCQSPSAPCHDSGRSEATGADRARRTPVMARPIEITGAQISDFIRSQQRGSLDCPVSGASESTVRGALRTRRGGPSDFRNPPSRRFRLCSALRSGRRSPAETPGAK